jgi:hypothetical protein
VPRGQRRHDARGGRSRAGSAIAPRLRHRRPRSIIRASARQAPSASKNCMQSVRAATASPKSPKPSATMPAMRRRLEHQSVELTHVAIGAQ